MRIAGITPCTLLDFPDTPSCILFFAGCNLRCGYCHNPEMVLPEQMSTTTIPWETVLHFLEKRKGLLEGVVLCGGEPTIVPELFEICLTLKHMGYKVKLDTNGTHPEILSQLLDHHLVDYIALDYKCTSDALQSMCQGELFAARIQQTLSLLRTAHIPYEVRSTVIAEIHSQEQLRRMAFDLQGVSQWILQMFRPQITLDPLYAQFHGYSQKEMESLTRMLSIITGGDVTYR